MIKTKRVQTRINGANRAHYEELGYTGSHNELIDVLPEHLPPKSNMRIISVCDDCGIERDVAFHQYRDFCQSCAQTGERNVLYKPSRHFCACGSPKARGVKCWECYTRDVHNPDAIKRSNTDHKWSLEIKEIAGYQCDICESDECLQAHHLESFMGNEPLRRELTNGVCLCKSCHLAFHKMYGFGDNRTKQYLEFKGVYNGSN